MTLLECSEEIGDCGMVEVIPNLATCFPVAFHQWFSVPFVLFRLADSQTRRITRAC